MAQMPGGTTVRRLRVDGCGRRVIPIYGVLHRECFSLFPDEMFAELVTDVGRLLVAERPREYAGHPQRRNRRFSVLNFRKVTGTLNGVGVLVTASKTVG